MAYLLVPLPAAVNGTAEEEEELDGKFSEVDRSMLDNMSCLDAPITNNEGDSPFLASPVDGVPLSDVACIINAVGTKAAVPAA